jgi:RHS repeat-associated protein
MNHNIYRLLTIMALLCASGMSYGQTQLAFAQQEVIKLQGQTTDLQVDALTPMTKQTTRVYYDGLGRPIQTVAVQGSPLQNDLIQPVAYDNLGRQTTSYLPYAGTSSDVMGSYRSNAISTAQPAFYNNTSQHLVATDADPYSQRVFETSPLQRMLQAGMTGIGFQPGATGSYTKTASYRPNSAASDGAIMEWGPDGTKQSSNYADNTLSVSIGTDEDGVKVTTFTDVAGRMVLKRQAFSATVNYDTYYVYNLAGMLSYIIPPKAIVLMQGSSNYSLSQASINILLFSFVYNGKGQLTNKTVPGKGTMNIIYDPLNRPVLMQDANLAANYQWNYIKYDAKGRAISQGIYTDATHSTQSALQASVNGLNYGTVWFETRSSVAANGYYTNSIFPTTSLQPLAYAFYDDYNLNGDANNTPDYAYTTATLPGEVGATSAQLKGMPTMMLKSTVGSGMTAKWLLTVQFYDRNLHPVQVKSNNLLNYTNETTVTDTKTVVPDFTGMPMSSRVVKVTGSPAVTNNMVTSIAYDHMYRVTGVTQTYNSQSPLQVAGYKYNELGQVVTKQLGSTGTGWLQQVNMRYNIRGQLVNINNSTLTNDSGVTDDDTNPLFGMQLFYDKTDNNLSFTPYHDGKLTAVKWMNKDNNNNSSKERSFVYSYDALNRYAGATYAERAAGASSTTAFTVTHGWDEQITQYDENGNIMHLNRNATTQGSGTFTPIDNLAYTYNTTTTPNANQLYQVADATNVVTGFGIQANGIASGHYVYDPNGNLTSDPYKAIGLSYNVLNRTDKISFTAVSGQYINYIYDASGNVLEKQQYSVSGGVSSLTTKTDYIDGFVYVNGALAYFPMPEGRVNNVSGTCTPEYIISDQQGNARISFNNLGTGGTAKVTQETSYYGFGMVLPGGTVNGGDNNNLYNGGNEWQNDYGNLPNYYQTFYRNFDAALGRFIGVDPEAESAESMTSYQYAGNNPVMNNDPLGNLLRPTGSGPSFIYWTPNTSFGAQVPGDIQSSVNGYYNGAGGNLGPTPEEVYEDMAGVGPDVAGHWSSNSTDQPLSNFMSSHGLTGINYIGTSGASASVWNMLSPFHGYNISFSADGVITGADYASENDGGISATLGGNQSGIDDSILLALLQSNGSLPSSVGAIDANQGGESLLGQIWNSSLARAIVPDLIGLHFHGTLVPTVGAGYSINIDFITRGKDAGLHESQTVSGRIGEEAGVGISFIDGHYNGGVNEANFNYNSLMGWGVDISGELGPVNVGVWGSFHNVGLPTWYGTSAGVGFGIGGSAGVSYSTPLK